MRRAEAIAVIIALLATPLALLARATPCDRNQCTAMCCLIHGSHSAQARRGKAPLCGRCAGSDCSMSSKHSPNDYGFIAPIAPTAPSSLAGLAIPNAARQESILYAESTAAGFLSIPFEPPRV